ncbi:MAG: peptidylprolyl isomerase, partial [Paludibacteraceae bacterium]
MYKIFLTIVSILLAFNSFSQTKNHVIDEVIWIVGDQAIFKSDIESIIQDATIRRVSLEGDPYCTLPEQIAVEKLFLHQAAIDSITVNESAIIEMADREIDAYVANVGSVAKAEEYLHKSISALKEDMRERYRNKSMVQQMQQELVKNIEATPAEIRRHYSSLPVDSLPTIPTQVELQVLSLRPPIP